MLNPLHFFFDNSIKRAVMSSFVFVLLLPIAFFAYSLFENSWEKAQQNMLEKHELIAKSMVEPISLFVSSRQLSLQTLGDELQSIEKEGLNIDIKTQTLIKKYQESFIDVVSLTYSTNPGLIKHFISTKKQYITPLSIPDYTNKPLSQLPVVENGHSSNSTDLISPIFQSSISNKPVVLLKHYIRDENGQIKCALLLEISPKYVTNMCSKISFGDKGHCAIVDQSGHVVAHPNKNWEKEMHDMSKLSVIQKMLDGKTGTTEFYSPFLKADMVAGFSAIPTLGWGIMIPQPKYELTGTLDSLRKSTMIWMSLGLLIALFMAYLLMNKITTPIRVLTKRTHEVSAGHDFIKLGKLPKNSPREISQLWTSISRLLDGLQNSNREVKKLNVSLNRDIKKATLKLVSMNKHLYEVSSKDYLTSLANRRYFTRYIDKIMKQKRKENVGIILIDIDKFKFINDEYGHDAGDMTLKHLAKILKQATRQCDLVARLGGDEFVVYIKNTDDKSLKKAAEKFRHLIETIPFLFKDQEIKLTLSIGTVNNDSHSNFTLEDFLGFADKAMYLSKKLGRNKVSCYKFKQSIIDEKLEA